MFDPVRSKSNISLGAYWTRSVVANGLLKVSPKSYWKVIHFFLGKGAVEVERVVRLPDTLPVALALEADASLAFFALRKDGPAFLFLVEMKEDWLGIV